MFEFTKKINFFFQIRDKMAVTLEKKNLFNITVKLSGNLSTWVMFMKNFTKNVMIIGASGALETHLVQ